MKFLRRHWYDVSAGIGLATLLLLVSFWNEFSVLQRLSIANFAVLMFHVFEEFGYPGGFGKLANTVLYKNSPAPDRWPLSQNSAMIGNWSFAALFYIPPIVFPDNMIVGLMPMLFGAIGQSISHVFMNNILMKTWYNSGLATTLFGHIPLAIAYGYHVEVMGLATAWDWIIACIYAVFAYVVVFRLGIMKLLEDKASPYPFAAEELARFDRLYSR